MRHRITYIHANHAAAVQLVSAERFVLSPETDYVQEKRTTAAAALYSHIKDLRVQVSADDRPSFPFSYDFGLGVHIYAVPEAVGGTDDRETFYSQVQDAVFDLLGIKVGSDAFILAYNSFYYHASGTEYPGAFSRFELAQNWLKIDFFYSNGEISLKSLSHKPETTISKPHERTEIGVFSVLDQSEPDDVILSGGRYIMGDEADNTEKMTKTMFHIKPRHRRLKSRVSTRIAPNGLHPVMEVAAYVQDPPDPDITNCELYAYLALEKSVFVDPYQTPSGLSLVASYGPQNLELPEYSVPQWGNELLFEPKKVNDSVAFNLTLHSRYQLPKAKDSTQVTINKPALFYACEVSDDALLLKQSPFDNFRYIGGTFEKFFTENSVFYHVPDAGHLSVSIPNATGDQSWTNVVTFAALFVGIVSVFVGLFNRFKAQKTRIEKKVQ